MFRSRKIYEIIEKSEDGGKASLFFNWFLTILILLNLVAIILGSIDSIDNLYSEQLFFFECFSTIFFTVEYIARVWVAQYKYNNSKRPALRYIFSFMGVIDLLAILPFYLPFVMSINLTYLRILRLFRLLRILKLNRYNNSLDLLVRVLRNEKDNLFLMLFITIILLLFTSSTMYYIENPAQPDKFTNIVATLWWAVATLTTIGYGDVYPITPLGKALGGIIAILGIGLIALPSGIICSGLIQEAKKNKKPICPHCGKEIE